MLLSAKAQQKTSKLLITEKDTLFVLKASIEGLDTLFQRTFTGQSLSIINENQLKKNYAFKIHGQDVKYVTDWEKEHYDWQKPKYFVQIESFKLFNKNKISFILWFKECGDEYQFSWRKLNNKWVLIGFKKSKT